MSNYRRAHSPGGSFFFTVVTHNRRLFLTNTDALCALHESVTELQASMPFTIDAWVILPDHFHCIWTLPMGDYDFSKRMGRIKAGFSRRCPHYSDTAPSSSRIARNESTIWQRRFWEHCIRDERDYARHLDYIHVNPLKHGLVHSIRDWPHSTFHRHVNKGIYPPDWCGDASLKLLNDSGE